MSEESTKVSRRGALKWAGALAAVGVVGVGLGFGGDLLLRPNNTTTQTATETSLKTATQTSLGVSTVTQPGVTQTVTQPGATQTATVTQPTTVTMTTTQVPPPPATISYLPPLTSDIQSKVSQIVNSSVAAYGAETTFYTTCKQNGCRGPACVLKGRVVNGKVVSMEPDDETINFNNPREDAKFSDIMNGFARRQGCPMGFALHYELYMPDRVLYPMKRVGPRGAGQFQRIQWSEALDTLASWINDTMNTFGPNTIWQSTFGLTNCWPGQGFVLGHYTLNVGLMGWGDHSSTGVTIPRMMALGGSTNCSIQDVFDSKLIVLWGNTPTHTEVVTLPYYLRLAKERGIPIIHIDPRYTQTSESIASQWIAIRPGTDIAMILAVCNVLFKNNLVNTSFINQWVEPTGYQKFKDYVLGNAAGPDGAIDRTPQWAEKICGVPAETITAFAQLYASSSPTKVLYFLGPPRSDYLNTTRAIIYLTALTGYISQKGGGEPFQVAGTYNDSIVSFPAINWGRKWTRNMPTLLANLKYHRAILDRPKVDSGQMTALAYNASIGNKSTNPLPNIQMIIYDANYLNNQFDMNARIQAVKSVKYVWGWAWHQSQPTMQYLDLVLPAPIWPYEDMTTSQSNFTSGGPPNNHFMYLASPIITPQGEVRPIEWTMLRIASRLGGIDAQHNPILYNQISDTFDVNAWRNALDVAHQAVYEAWAKTAAVTPYNPPSWADFKKKPVLYFPAVNRGSFDPADYPTAGKPYAAANAPVLKTTDLIEFYNPFLASPTAADTSFSTRMGTTTLGIIGSGAGPLPMWVPGTYGTFYDKRTANYPLILLTCESRFRTHSAYFNNPMLNGDCYRHACWLNPGDAQARNISDGDLVHVYSNRGEMVIEAYVTSRIAPGVACVYHGGWYTPDGQKTALNADGMDRGGAPNLILEDVEPEANSACTIGPSLDKGVCQVEKF